MARPSWCLLLPILALLSFGNGAPKIEWSESYDAALAQAAEEGKVIFVATSIADEARCEHFAKVVYRDKAVLVWTNRTVNVMGCVSEHKKKKECPKFPGSTCEQHRRIEADLRERLILVNDKEVAATPQHLWLTPEGKLLFSVPFEMTADELSWCFTAAHRIVHPNSFQKFTEDARPPRRLTFGRSWSPVPGDELARGLLPTELAEDLKKLKTSRGGGQVPIWLSVLFTDEDKAVDHARTELGGSLSWVGGGITKNTVRFIGATAPQSFHTVVAEFQGSPDSSIRREVAVAYEQLAADKSLPSVLKGLSGEKNPKLVPAWLRAVGACGFGNKKARRALLKACKNDEDDVSRRNALIALGSMDRRDDIREALTDGLASDDSLDRIAAACGMALARDPLHEKALKETIADCADAKEKGHLQTALHVLLGADAAALKPIAVLAAGDQITRERLFFGEITAPVAPEKDEEPDATDPPAPEGEDQEDGGE